MSKPRRLRKARSAGPQQKTTRSQPRGKIPTPPSALGVIANLRRTRSSALSGNIQRSSTIAGRAKSPAMAGSKRIPISVTPSSVFKRLLTVAIGTVFPPAPEKPMRTGARKGSASGRRSGKAASTAKRSLIRRQERLQSSAFRAGTTNDRLSLIESLSPVTRPDLAGLRNGPSPGLRAGKLTVPTSRQKMSNVSSAREPNERPEERPKCKPRPDDWRDKGGGSRAFVPWCDRRR